MNSSFINKADFKKRYYGFDLAASFSVFWFGRECKLHAYFSVALPNFHDLLCSITFRIIVVFTSVNIIFRFLFCPILRKWLSKKNP